MQRLVWNADRTEGALTFIVIDAALGTIRSCVATWPRVALPNPPQNTQQRNPPLSRDIHIFNVADGSVTLVRTDIDTDSNMVNNIRVASEPNDYRLNDDCEYDADAPSNTPFAPGNPARRADVFIDGNPVAIGNPEPNSPFDIYEPGDIELAYGASQGATAQIRFSFYAVDAYGAEAMRARVASGEDSVWAALREIAVRDELGVARMATSTTAVLSGEARVSTSHDALAPGDSRLYVRSPHEYLQVHYHSAGGEPTRSARSPSRRISVEFGNAPREHGDTVVFYISDSYLGTTRTCAAVWENIPGAVAGNTDYWRLADGDPFPDVFALEGEGCAYDAGTPIFLPAHPVALVRQSDEQEAIMQIDSVDQANWRIALRNEVSAGNSLRVIFNQMLRDRFPASAMIARVYSSSDRAGEWVAIREVVSKTDDSPAAASHLFRGEIEISMDESSRAPGDGKVFVRRTSRLWVAYYDINNAAAQLGRISQPLNLIMHTPTPPFVPAPIPAASRLTLALAAAAFSALTAYALMRRRGWLTRAKPKRGRLYTQYPP